MAEVWFEKCLSQREARKIPVGEGRGLTPEEEEAIIADVAREKMVKETLRDLRKSGVVTGKARRFGILF